MPEVGDLPAAGGLSQQRIAVNTGFKVSGGPGSSPYNTDLTDAECNARQQALTLTRHQRVLGLVLDT